MRPNILERGSRGEAVSIESSGSLGLGYIVAIPALPQCLTCFGKASAPDLDGFCIEAPNACGVNEAELVTHDSSMQRGCDSFESTGRRSLIPGTCWLCSRRLAGGFGRVSAAPEPRFCQRSRFVQQARFANRDDKGRDMSNTEIRKAGVIGAGTMGSGIAEVSAKGGVPTVVVEIDAALAEAAQIRVEKSAEKAVDRAKMTEAERDALLSNLSFTTSYDELADADLVIEAVVELKEVKFDIFRKLDEVVQPSGILASNTSSIPIVEIGAVTGRADQVLGMHFFNPAQVQPLVELIYSQKTSDATIAAARAFCVDTLNKTAIQTGDRAGFVVNRLLVPYLLQAMQMFDRGQASKEDIDAGMRGGCAHPMGPLELSDLIGLDTMLMVAEVLYDEFKELVYAPPAVLRRMVAAGELGRKTGKGFYEYA